jgi:hypothetical protein
MVFKKLITCLAIALLESQAQAQQTSEIYTIPIDNLSKGNYLVKISDGKTVSSQTLIISR